MTCAIEDANHLDHVAAEFARLRAEDDRWQFKCMFSMSAFVRTWDDGTDDAVFVLRENNAFGVRHAPDGRQCWGMPGTLRQVVGHMMRLQSPNSPQPLGLPPPRVERDES